MNHSINVFGLLQPYRRAATVRTARPIVSARSQAATWAQMFFFALLVRPLLLFVLGLRVRGGEQLRAVIRNRQQVILIANHSSHLDTLALLSLFPLAQLRRLRPVAAADYFERNWLIAWLSRTFFNILPIPRAHFMPSNHPVARMKAALDAGDSLILFPEGTRGCHAQMQHFRAGIAHLVQEAPDVPVLPAYLLNLGRSLPKGEFIPVPLFAEARFGSPLRPQGTRAEIIAQLEAAVRALQNQQ
jgi:1-acyl-sn-glycerol-3-phosphate acyltransferase